MPVSINTAALKYRDQQGTYQSINSIKGDNGALNIVAPAYENLTYPVAAGQGCIYNDLYYVAKQDITSQESWTSEHWEQRMIADEVHGMVQDVQVNGVSILQNGVANVPRATNNNAGVVKLYPNGGIMTFGSATDGLICLNVAADNNIKLGIGGYNPITPAKQHSSAFYGMAKAAGDTTQSQSSNAVGTYTEDAKSSISQMLNGAVQVTGTTPVITAKSGIRYICGECATLDIAAPASGIIDVVFESGSTPTVLTVTPPTGITAVKWANGFDPTSLEANTKYEISIMDGELGAALSWT